MVNVIFNLKIIDIKVKIHARNVIKISWKRNNWLDCVSQRYHCLLLLKCSELDHNGNRNFSPASNCAYNLYSYLYEFTPASKVSSVDINIEEILPIMYLFQSQPGDHTGSGRKLGHRVPKFNQRRGLMLQGIFHWQIQTFIYNKLMRLFQV